MCLEAELILNVCKRRARYYAGICPYNFKKSRIVIDTQITITSYNLASTMIGKMANYWLWYSHL